MSRQSYIPPEQFRAALESLDRAAFAAFVGDVYRHSADDVAVDGPTVTVRNGETVTTLRVEVGDQTGRPDGTNLSVGDCEGIDAVVTTRPDDSPDGQTIGPTDLHQRVQYGLSPETADRLCKRHLDRPARSPAYTTGTDGGPGSGEKGTTTGSGKEAARTRPSPMVPGAYVSRAKSVVGTVGPWVVLVGVVGVLFFGTGTGAVFVDLASDVGSEGVGTPDGEAGDTATETETASDADAVTADTPDDRTDQPDGSEGPGATPAATPVTETMTGAQTLEAQRYAAVRPNCERSFLHVVQIQMNALKYNDNESDDGIRTVRRFASPRNREAVGPFERFVRIVKSPTYEPMLNYDSAEYTPRRTSADTAHVRVVTREAGNVTGRYVFRLRKQESTEYDGCWMTEGVQSLQDAPGSDVE